MLIRAAFANMFSFNEEETISLVAGKTQALSSHVIPGNGRYEPSLLKSAVLYGANASGKSNLIKCFDIARTMILKGTKADERLPRIPFKLCRKNVNMPSSFQVEFKIDEGIFAYRVVFTEQIIVEERLTRIGKTTEKDLFFRTTKEGVVDVSGGGFLKKKEDTAFFNFIARGTRPNQLFLRETIERNSPWFRPQYDWFKNRLVIIYPNSLLDPPWELLIRSGNRVNDNYHDFFEMLDLGIAGVEIRELDLEKERGLIPDWVMDQVKKQLPENKSLTLLNFETGRFRFFRDEKGTMHAYRLMMKHQCADEEEPVFFEVREESDGTKRLIDLIPLLVDLCESDRVVLIDEIDRSMHAQLTRAFFEYFFGRSKATTQIIATTHELDILDLELFRKDEIWFVEKDKASTSHIYSLEEFKPRYDKDVRRGYLAGRFGAIPIVKNFPENVWKT
jgi:AAA15 family ATPase/GTPase